MRLSATVEGGYSFNQFFDDPGMDGITGDFAAWLSATAINLGLNYQAGSDARTSAANFYSAFETKLQEQQAVQAAQASGAPLPVSGGVTTSVSSGGVTTSVSSGGVVTSVSPGGLVTTVPASQAVYSSAPATASTMDFLPSSVSADQLTANALTPAQPSGIPWGAILTIASIALAAFGN